MKKIMILIGCWRGQFVKDIKFFDYLEKELKCKVYRIGDFTYTSLINGKKLIFQFCFGPKDDNIWRKRKKIAAEEDSKLPPSIEHIAKKGINADKIYYLGFCGVLNGKKHTVYLPNKFVEITFDKYFLDKNSIKNMKISKVLTYKNKLIGLIKGNTCKDITSNQVISPRYTGGNSEALVKELVRRLKKIGDIIDMENYEIIKNFSKTHPIGMFIYSTDIPGKKGRQIGQIKYSWNKFRKVGINMIKEVVR